MRTLPRHAGIHFQPFHPRHLQVLDLQEAQAQLSELIREPRYGELLANDYAWSLVGREGVVHGCGGILPFWTGRAKCWLLIGDMPRRAWPAAAHRCQAVLRAARGDGFRRIEADVKADFPEAIRFAQRMGFEFQWYMDGYAPDGADFWRCVWKPHGGGGGGGDA